MGVQHESFVCAFTAATRIQTTAAYGSMMKSVVGYGGVCPAVLHLDVIIENALHKMMSAL